MPRRPTRDPHHRPAMQTLERLHSELGGQILENRHKHQKLADDMRHVEAVLKMLEPGYDVRPIAVKRRKPNPWFKRGTVYRAAVDTLREATGPLSAREIVDIMLASKQVTNPDKKAVVELVGAVMSSLRNHAGHGITVDRMSRPVRWQLTR